MPRETYSNVDKMHEKCTKCDVGSYEEIEDIDDHICCDMCGDIVERWYEEKGMYESFQKFLIGVQEKESRNKNKRFLNEETAARRYVKRYTELPQNRIVLKGK